MIKEVWKKLTTKDIEYIKEDYFICKMKGISRSMNINSYYRNFHKTSNANGNSKFKSLWERRKQNEPS